MCRGKLNVRRCEIIAEVPFRLEVGPLVRRRSRKCSAKRRSRPYFAFFAMSVASARRRPTKQAERFKSLGSAGLRKVSLTKPDG